MAGFAGFPKATTMFVRDLSANNTKEWFQGHRDQYETYWLEPAKDFVAAAGAALRTIDRGIVAEARINGSIFRINRDVRFSKDKRPYKDHLDLWFWEGERKTAVSGYFFRLTPKSLGLGAGAHSFDSDRLAAYRGKVVDTRAGASLKRAVTTSERAGWQVQGEHYKRLPGGYDVSGAAAERLIRHNALWVGDDEPLPDVVFSPELVDHCLDRWRAAAPIHRWLVRELSS